MDEKVKSNLLRMPLVILRIVLEDLHALNREGFYNFRLVSKACRLASEFLIFQNIALNDATLVTKIRSLELAKRITEKNGRMREYVRHLKLGPFADEQWFYHDLSPLLQDILESLKHLQSLTWDNHRAIQPNFLGIFHRLHSAARLHVVLRDRGITPLNRALLSSPQLYTLDISIFRIQDYPHPKGSELRFVKNCLGSSLRVLRLQFHDPGQEDKRCQVMEWETVQPGPAFFDWSEGDQFGPLEELALKYDEYDLAKENCDMWATVTCWERLKKLDLDMGSPRHFFASLTGRAVNLKSLKFWISPPRQSSWDFNGSKPLDSGTPILEKFISSIRALRELEFGAHDIDEFSTVLCLMLENMRGSLRVLQIRSGTWAKPPWTPEQYVKVLDQTPGLEYFHAKIKEDTVEGDWEISKIHLSGDEKFELAAKNIQALPDQQNQRRHRIGVLI